MDVRPAGVAPPVLESLLGLRLPAVAGLAPAPEDQVADLLQLLATPQFHNLIDTIDAQVFTRDTVVLDNLLRTAATAVVNHDVPRAIASLTEYITRNPEHAVTLLNNPALLPIQAEVKGLLRHLTHAAGGEAQRLFETAHVAVDAALKHPQELNGPMVLDIAQRLIESGQLANYLRASELSRTIISSYKTGKVNSVKPPGSIRRLWRRAPLLVLLLGWLGIGVGWAALGAWLRPSTVQLGFELWATGFLALIVFQFFFTTRNSRGPRSN